MKRIPRTVVLVGVNRGIAILGTPHPIVLNRPYSFTFQAVGGIGNTYTFSLTGDLPTDITFTDNGDGTATLAGTTTDLGTFPIKLQVNDGTRFSPMYTFALIVNKLTLQLLQAKKVIRGVAVSGLLLFASGGAGGYVITSSGGPDGVSFDESTGIATGTPTTAGAGTIDAEVEDADGNIFSDSFDYEVLSGLTVVSGTPPRCEDGVPYSYRFRIAGNTGALSYALTGFVTMPTGLAFDDTTGTIAGTPVGSYPGPYFGTVTITDAGSGESIDIPYAFTGAAALTLHVVSSATGYAGDTIIGSVDVGLTTGIAPIIWSIDQSTIPAGATVQFQATSDDFASLFIMAPLVTDSTVTIRARDAVGAQASIDLPIVTIPANQNITMFDGAGAISNNPSGVLIYSDDASIDVIADDVSGVTRYALRAASSGSATPLPISFQFSAGGGFLQASDPIDGDEARSAGTIASWSMFVRADDGAPSSVVVDVFKTNAGSYGVGSSITGSAKPTLTAQTAATSSTLTGWTTSIAAGDIFYAQIVSISGNIRGLTLVLRA